MTLSILRIRLVPIILFVTVSSCPPFTTAASKELKRQQSKPDFSSLMSSFMPQLNTAPNLPSFSQLSTSNIHQLPQYGGMGFNNNPLYPNRVISYGGPSSYGYNNNNGYYGSPYSSYNMFPNNNYQNYVFDPYVSHFGSSQFGSYPSIGSSHHNIPSMTSASRPTMSSMQNKPHRPQQSANHFMTPPFGFIEKQLRNPNENPGDFAKLAPPKAIMTTATDVIGLRGQSGMNAPGGTDFINFLLNPNHEHNGNGVNKQANSDPLLGFSPSRKRPPVMSFNNFNNKENSQFNYINNNNDRYGYGDGQLKSKKFGKPVTLSTNAIKVKSINGTEIEIALDELEDDDEPLKNNFISEPVLRESPMTTPNWSTFFGENGPSKHKELPGFEDYPYHHYQQHKYNQPHNILPDYELLQRQPMHMEPIPLFTTTEDGEIPEENKFDFDTEVDGQVDDISNNEVKGDDEKKTNQRVYNCPTSRDLRELSQAEVYPDPQKCDQFYYCKWGKAYVFKCPVNHSFNPYLKACDVDEDFACAMSLNKKK